MSFLRFADSLLRRLSILVLPRSLFLRKGYDGIALTFDDGPDPDHTIPLLKELEKQNVRATFFLVGERVLKYPEIVSEILRNGHEIGNHSMTHSNYVFKPITDYKAEIQGNFDLLRNKTGSSANIFRPPYGITTIPLLFYCWRKSITLVHWSFDFADGNGVEASKVEILEKSKKIAEGDILLMHDDHPIAKEIVAIAIPALRKVGFEFKTISEML